VERVRAAVVGQHFYVRDLDFHLLPGRDVRHRLREDVRPLLLEEARGLSAGERRLVGEARFRPAPDRPHDPPLADHHRHVVHGGGMGKGEDVDGLDRLVVGILERLPHAHAGDEARDLRVDVGVAQRTLDELAAAGGAQGALRDLVLGGDGDGGAGLDRRRCNAQGGGQGDDEQHQYAVPAQFHGPASLDTAWGRPFRPLAGRYRARRVFIP
jgi:hypothetical protein